MWRQKLRDLDIEPARYVNLALATWILISAYLWPHSGAQFLITGWVGAVVAVLAPFEVGSPLVRKITVAAGGLLVVAAVALPHTSTLTQWHNVVAGLAVIVVSFFGPPHGIVPPRPEAPDGAYDATGGV